MTSRLFNVASDPNHPFQTVLDSSSPGGFPFHVVLQSDLDPVPEPMSLILLGTVILGCLGCRHPRSTWKPRKLLSGFSKDVKTSTTTEAAPVRKTLAAGAAHA